MFFKMQQMHSSSESMSGIVTRGGENPSMIVRTDLSSLLSDYTSSQRRYNDRLESLEREMACLKGQVGDAFTASNEHELNRTFTTKKPLNLQPTSARVHSPSRIPLPVTPRRSFNDDKSAVSTSHTSVSHPLSARPVGRSKSFHHHNNNTSDEANLLRSYKLQPEQTRQKDSSTSSDIRIPNYSSLDEVIRANEQLLLENDRLRSDLNRLKTENLVLLRSMKATTTENEPNLGSDRIIAERERQVLAMELAQHAEENKRLRKSLLAQSAKFITLRQAIPNSSLSTINEYRPTTQQTKQSTLNSSRVSKPKSARYSSNSQGFDRTNAFYHGSQDVL